jgi:hypothetical protein
MTFGGKTPNKAEAARRDACKAGNCMACEQRGKNVKGMGLVQWHHLNGKKKHMETIGLCIWHHIGADVRLPLTRRDARGIRPELGGRQQAIPRGVRE